MKALTLYPEHAEGFKLGVRSIETRGWATRHRGPLALHAGMRDPDCAAARRSPRSQAMLAALPHGQPLTCGAIVATATLADCLPIGENQQWHAGRAVKSCTKHGWHLPVDQRPYGDFTPGRWAWILEDVKPTTERCPACGCFDGGCFVRRPHSHQFGCWTCESLGRCDPVPARGRQGLWTWTP